MKTKPDSVIQRFLSARAARTRRLRAAYAWTAAGVLGVGETVWMGHSVFAIAAALLLLAFGTSKLLSALEEQGRLYDLHTN